MSNIQKSKTFTLCLPFEEGYLKVSSSETEIIGLAFEESATDSSSEVPSVLGEAKKQLESYLKGNRISFDLPLAPRGTDFQKRVWAELQNIPFGKTISYLDLAKKLGDEKVIRASASANGKNPIPLIIPCHRVIGQNGKLVGFSGGLHRKKWLLDHENKHANGVLTLF